MAAAKDEGFSYVRWTTAQVTVTARVVDAPPAEGSSSLIRRTRVVIETFHGAGPAYPAAENAPNGEES